MLPEKSILLTITLNMLEMSSGFQVLKTILNQNNSYFNFWLSTTYILLYCTHCKNVPIIQVFKYSISLISFEFDDVFTLSTHWRYLGREGSQILLLGVMIQWLGDHWAVMFTCLLGNNHWLYSCKKMKKIKMSG